MAELVTPPWDLCGFDRSFDPYSWPEERRFVVQWAWNDGRFGPAEMVVRPARDPNGRDGEWRELVFMPHAPVGFTHQVPLYYSVEMALAYERGRRLARRMWRGQA